MAKFSGVLGVVTNQIEELDSDGIPTGVYKSVVTRYPVRGDIIRHSRSIDTSSKVNGDITLSNSFSILASPYLLTVMSAEDKDISIYLEIWGQKWRVESIELALPRVTLSVGGLWHENSDEAT